MFDFDRETMIYFTIIAVALYLFFRNSQQAKATRKDRKNVSFRRRYQERKKELEEEKEKNTNSQNNIDNDRKKKA